MKICECETCIGNRSRDYGRNGIIIKVQHILKFASHERRPNARKNKNKNQHCIYVCGIFSITICFSFVSFEFLFVVTVIIVINDVDEYRHIHWQHQSVKLHINFPYLRRWKKKGKICEYMLCVGRPLILCSRL